MTQVEVEKVYIPIKKKFEKCVMCDEQATYYAPVSMEPLCDRCCNINEEAFKKR